MKKLEKFINEKLYLDKYKDVKHSYFPKNKNELKTLIKELISKRGGDANLNDIDVSNITDMSFLFYGLRKPSVKNIDISQWDVSNVTTMYGMFKNCYSFNCDLNSWDVSNVINMSYMFFDCLSFNGENTKNWKTKKNIPMDNIFTSVKNKPTWYHE